MKNKIIFFFISGIFILASYVFASDFPAPANTELLQQKGDAETEMVCTYRSGLSEEKIIEFYRNLFSKQGYKEKQIELQGRSIIIFADNTKKTTRTIAFNSPQDGSKTTYKLFFRRMQNGMVSQGSAMNFLSRLMGEISDPDPVDFMPLYPGVKQLEHLEWRESDAVSMGYLTHDQVPAIESFYKENMLPYGWSLQEEEPYRGKYEVKQWIPLVAPHSSLQYLALPNIPPLEIHGLRLIFTKGRQSCLIAINTFMDAVELSKDSSYDISFMKENGNTIISVIYSRSRGIKSLGNAN